MVLDERPELTTAATWSSRYLLAPSTFRACVTSTTPSTYEHVTATFSGRHRAIRLRVAPGRAATTLTVPPNPARVGPWSGEADKLQYQPARATRCSACNNSGERRCDVCRGTSTATCITCEGKGSAVSARTGVSAPCGACEGVGKRPCSCVDGRRSCNACAGSGVVDASLVLIETPFQRVVSGGGGEARDGDVAMQWSGAPADAPDDVGEWIDKLAPEFREGERFDHVEVTVRRSSATTIAYTLAGATGDVRVRGATVDHAETAPLRARGWLLALAAASGVLWAVSVWGAFVGRHPWYASAPGAGALLLLGPAFVLIAVALAAESCVPGPSRGLRRASFATLAAALLVGQAAAAVSGAPTMTDAEARLATGDNPGALTEANACADLGIDADRAAVLLDGDRLANLRAETDVAKAVPMGLTGFRSVEAQEQAHDLVVEKVVRQVDADQAAGRWGTTAATVNLLPEPDRRAPTLLPLLAAVALHDFDGCAVNLDAACATKALGVAQAASASDAEIAPHRLLANAAVLPRVTPMWTTIRTTKARLSDRADACAATLAPFAFIAVAGSSVFQPARADVDTACAPVYAAVSAEKARADAAAVAKAKREADAQLREEARQARAQAAADRANRPLVCADGAYSPSCTCGGSWQGCCSSHGGVAGCAR